MPFPLCLSLFLRPSLRFLITYGAYGSLVWSNFPFFEQRYEGACWSGNISILFGRYLIQTWLRFSFLRVSTYSLVTPLHAEFF
jgi:hypothetical protein